MAEDQNINAEDIEVEPNSRRTRHEDDLKDTNKHGIKYSSPSSMSLTTIPSNTILYHGSTTVSQFNTEQINLGKDTLVAFFSPNIDFAASYIGNCMGGHSGHHSDGAPPTGYIHKFRTKYDVHNIYVISSHDKLMNWEPKRVDDKFCKTPVNDRRLNGVCFFVPAENKMRFTDEGQNQNGGKDPFESGQQMMSEIALCDPGSVLEYVGTFQCLGARTLSTEYDFVNP